ncbi:helix-turn-helix domain-containing protein [Streptomyces lincolnensis]|uniref:helix-turn-helix domain-containing protein n=1 Tax=Streptomyces lincolnensis TaxID=1915 RepID=UPI001E5C771B|nr:helix-turn-helix domain-containing protein [Streptomyces lincolnensis]MCD7438973.1 helix-turn-helix domain-containing protein [Streptomyces lincolnensis]
MQIHRIPTHERDFVIIANKAIQDPRISHTARGILALVLSLPSGVKENVRTLSDNYPQGRSAVAKAVKELREFGYWVTKTARDEETAQIVSTVDVYEQPNLASAPVPTRPVTGRAATRKAGTSPYGEKGPSKDGEKNPPSPPAEPGRDESAPSGADEREGSSEKQDQDNRQAAEAARILRRFAAIDTRLKLSDRQANKLVPQVADWLDRGATIAEITDAVTQGLPPKVYSAGRLIADRLDRKRPDRKRKWKTYADCSGRCGGLLPAGQETGICADCALGTTTYFEIDCASGEITEAPAVPAAEPLIGGPNADWRAARAALRA